MDTTGLTGSSNASVAPQIAPPIAPRRPHTITQHGETRIDDYFWLRNRDDPAVMDYLKAENAYTEQMMAGTRALQGELFAEMKGRMQEIDVAVPEKLDDFHYYWRMEAGKQYPIHCRKHGSLDAPEEVLLDENSLAAGKPFFHLGVFRISDDHRWLAYSIDTSGAETYTLFVKDLTTGKTLPEQIPNTYYGVAWASDNRTLFYNVLDAIKRPYRVYRHVIGTDPAQDVLVYHETDEAFFAWVSRTSSKAFLLLSLAAGTTTEVRYLAADHPEGTFSMFAPRQREVEYSIAHHGERFFILTNENALNFKLLEAPVASPSREMWREVVPHRDDVMIDGMHVFRDYLVRFEREGGLKRIRMTRLSPDATLDVSTDIDVSFPEPVYNIFPGANEDFNSGILRFNYMSMVTPNSVIDYDMATGAWEVKKRDEIPSGYDPTQYQSERLMATAPDGKQVPISVVYKKGFARDGTHPMLLTGYGSYGISNDPGFDANRLSLLDRGFAYAIAHVRGGGEMGRAWFEDARLLHKKNTFTDFIACAEHLIALGYTSPEHLAIMGGSAGGLLMGAVTNMRPDLFCAVIADVPFVDVINTMSDPTIPLTVIEYAQWGNPGDKAVFDYMKTYSPYDNVAAKPYPNLLITGGLDDPRVAYWEPVKWTARLRACKTNDNLLLLKINLDAGHGGPSGRYSRLHEVAFRYAFLLRSVGMQRD